ncbi:Protein of unknown function [Gryllus bimaculatus]|nr:Protein of unknown function [Gryllus bimaculatus]
MSALRQQLAATRQDRKNMQHGVHNNEKRTTVYNLTPWKKRIINPYKNVLCDDRHSRKLRMDCVKIQKYRINYEFYISKVKMQNNVKVLLHIFYCIYVI